MPSLNPEFGRKLANLMRNYLKLQADVQSLTAMLDRAEADNAPPYGWREALELLRVSARYKLIADACATELAEMDQCNDQLEIERLLASMPPTQYPN